MYLASGDVEDTPDAAPVVMDIKPEESEDPVEQYNDPAMLEHTQSHGHGHGHGHGHSHGEEDTGDGTTEGTSGDGSGEGSKEEIESKGSINR